jgi:hypothetical protein
VFRYLRDVVGIIRREAAIFRLVSSNLLDSNDVGRPAMLLDDDRPKGGAASASQL